jgi:hypothetical protein
MDYYFRNSLLLNTVVTTKIDMLRSKSNLSHLWVDAAETGTGAVTRMLPLHWSNDDLAAALGASSTSRHRT